MIVSLDNLQLSDQIVASYQKDGFWIGPTLFDGHEVQALRREVMRTAKGQRDFDVPYWAGNEPHYDPTSLGLTHIVNAWWVNARIREVTKLSVLGAIASRLMGAPEVRLVHDQVLIKPGQGKSQNHNPEGNVGWHQDAAHWRAFNTTTFITAWIALQETDEANGCVRFARGSQRWGLQTDAHTFGDRDLGALAKKYSRHGNRKWLDTPCVLQAGQASFHSGLTFHGSAANRTDAARLSVVVNMMPGGTTFNEHGRQHDLYSSLDSPQGLPGPHVKHGEVCGNPLFPRIWPPEE